MEHGINTDEEGHGTKRASGENSRHRKRQRPGAVQDASAFAKDCCGQDGGQGSEGGRRGANEKRYIVYLFLDSAMECARLAASGGLRPMAAREASCVLRHVRPHPNPLPRRGGESAVVVL
jgi:hypothetical protein